MCAMLALAKAITNIASAFASWMFAVERFMHTLVSVMEAYQLWDSSWQGHEDGLQLALIVVGWLK